MDSEIVVIQYSDRDVCSIDDKILIDFENKTIELCTTKKVAKKLLVDAKRQDEWLRKWNTLPIYNFLKSVEITINRISYLAHPLEMIEGWRNIT